MKPKTAEKSDSTEPKRQNESTRERVNQKAKPDEPERVGNRQCDKRF
jgi:hypothetical protein